MIKEKNKKKIYVLRSGKEKSVEKCKMFSVYDELKSHPVACALTAEMIFARLISPQ